MTKLQIAFRILIFGEEKGRKDSVGRMATLLANCIDKRMPKILQQVRLELEIDEDFYHRTPTGCSLSVPQELAFFSFAASKLSVDKIFLVDHLQCKGYEDFYRKKFRAEEELSLHIENLLKSKELLKVINPEVEVGLYILTRVSKEKIEPIVTKVAEGEKLLLEALHC